MKLRGCPKVAALFFWQGNKLSLIANHNQSFLNLKQNPFFLVRYVAQNFQGLGKIEGNFIPYQLKHLP
jgi:hypothetical protein